MHPKLLIGEKVVDLVNPKPHQIDLLAIERALWTAHRFSNNHRALKVRQHTHLVRDLAILLKETSLRVIVWCDHHDDHEGIIGDVPGPLKSYIEHNIAHDSTALSLSMIEDKLDHAIASARGIEPPDGMVRQAVHFYDKLAETLEWLFVLNRPPEPWNRPWQNFLSLEEAMQFVEKVKALKPPPGLLN